MYNGNAYGSGSAAVLGCCSLTTKDMTTHSSGLLEDHKTFLNVDELAALLRVSKTSIYRLVERRGIPFHRLPRGLRFSKADIESYLQKTRVNAVESNYERTEAKKVMVDRPSARGPTHP